MKVIWEKSSTNIILSGEKLKSFLYNHRKDQIAHSYHFDFTLYQMSLPEEPRKKKIKHIQRKTPVGRCQNCITENPKECTKQFKKCSKLQDTKLKHKH